MEKTFEKLVAPVKELNELTLKSIDQIAAFQVQAIQENTKISVDSLKFATEIKDLDSLHNYLERQIAVAQNLSNNVVADGQEIANLSESYATSVKELVEKSVRAA